MSVSPEHYADFLQRIGHTVRQAGHSWWFDCASRVYSNFPFHHDVDVTSLDVADVLKSDGLILRTSCPQHQGVSSFRMICDDKNYDFPALRSRTRTQVRRGLEACSVRQIDFEELQRCYLPLQRATHERQGRRKEANDQQTWGRFFEAAKTTVGAETWAAFVNNEMAAYLVSFQIEETANLCIVRSDTRLLKSYPNNALLYRFLYETLRRPDIRQVSYGLQSVEPGGEELDRFKTGMGFRQEPCGQRIVFSGRISPLLKRPVLKLLQPCVRTLLKNESGRKIDGLLTWYQQQPDLGTATRNPNQLDSGNPANLVAAESTQA
ncbi:MAG: hypothetical protein R3C49_03205 [Planctomycetaceae bacterium]